MYNELFNAQLIDICKKFYQAKFNCEIGIGDLITKIAVCVEKDGKNYTMVAEFTKNTSRRREVILCELIERCLEVLDVYTFTGTSMCTSLIEAFYE